MGKGSRKGHASRPSARLPASLAALQARSRGTVLEKTEQQSSCRKPVWWSLKNSQGASAEGLLCARQYGSCCEGATKTL